LAAYHKYCFIIEEEEEEEEEEETFICYGP